MSRFLFNMSPFSDLSLPTHLAARPVADSMPQYGGATQAVDLIEQFAAGQC